MEPTITHDQLLDYAQGRLTPAEMTEIGRKLLQDPSLQQRYAHLRRLQRLIREHYQPEAVAHPEARDEAVAAMISSYVEAVRAGMAPPTEFAASLVAVPPVDSTGSHDALGGANPAHGLPATEPGVPGLAEVNEELAALERELAAAGIPRNHGNAAASSTESNDAVATLPRGRTRGSRVRTLLGYSAAASLLIAAAAFSFLEPGSLGGTGDDNGNDMLPEQWLPAVTPPERPDDLARPLEQDSETDDAPELPTQGDGDSATVSHDQDDDIPGETTDDPDQDTTTEHADNDNDTQQQQQQQDTTNSNSNNNSNGRRPGGYDVVTDNNNDEGDADVAETAARIQETVRRMAGSPPIDNLTGRASGSEVVVERGPLRGDLNGDGVVDERDVKILRDALVDLVELDGKQLYERLGPAADLTGNGRVEVRDLKRLQELANRRTTLEHQSPGHSE